LDLPIPIQQADSNLACAESNKGVLESGTERQAQTAFTRISRITPKAARRNANGSLEPSAFAD
jgi:hypothetical protein